MSKPNIQRNYNLNKINKIILPKLMNELKVYSVYFLVTAVLMTSLFAFGRNFALAQVEIQGDSMLPAFQTSDQIYIDKLSPHFSSYRRGEIVVLLPDKNCDPKEDLFIKRIIGLPGEQVIFDKGSVYILNPQVSDKPIKLDEESYLPNDTKTYKQSPLNLANQGEINKLEQVAEPILLADTYYFLGDNRNNSLDARKCGAVGKNQILGREYYKIKPDNKRGYANLPMYKNLPE
ncbi:MAG: signal peptidase I [Candidatus Parcubacteria bacterium]|nr:signal peptidase I [Candidatus Paceibacterota bacterium]